MEINQILQADVLDIIFEGKNKTYGAYELRKTYNKRLKTAMLLMIGCCLLVFMAAFAGTRNNHRSIAFIVKGEVILQPVKPVQPPVQPPPPVPPPPAPKPVATIKFSTPVLVNKTDVPPPTQSNIDKVAISTIDKAGEIKDIVAPPPEAHGIAGVKTPQVNEFQGEVFLVQKEAQFPGGAAAWKRLLERNLRADVPLENNAPAGTYTVVVTFLVDKEGNVSEVKAANNPGYGTAAEAVRVIKSGPKWIPAVQNGRNVIYRQKQAVTFRVEEGQ